MKRNGRLSFRKMVCLTLWCGTHGIRRQKLWLITEMMRTNTCSVCRQQQLKSQLH
ncbi:hypothetical protein HanPI659440_Chr12g0447311 [Helianthus annuus]|nr:hypothetical protein HanPI659440_Chr12g0447311 [Helianthus annuus]